VRHGETPRPDHALLDPEAVRGLSVSMADYHALELEYCECEDLCTCRWEENVFWDGLLGSAQPEHR
jgi:hypothetical protein